MKIEVPYENGQVFQNFGHSAQFKIQDYPQLCFMAGIWLFNEYYLLKKEASASQQLNITYFYMHIRSSPALSFTVCGTPV